MPNPEYPKIIHRSRYEDKFRLGEVETKVVYTSGWDLVQLCQGVECRTWEVPEITLFSVDGADVRIRAGGYTPIQLVEAECVLVDAPEEGEGYYCVLDAEGQDHLIHFDGNKKIQMVLTKGMIISCVAVSPLLMTEFESPRFTLDMFSVIPDDFRRYESREVGTFIDKVIELRKSVELFRI